MRNPWQWLYLLPLPLALVGGKLWWDRQPDGPELLLVEPVAYDHSALLGLEPFGPFDPEQSFAKEGENQQDNPSDGHGPQRH